METMVLLDDYCVSGVASHFVRRGPHHISRLEAKIPFSGDDPHRRGGDEGMCSSCRELPHLGLEIMWVLV